LDQSRLIVRNPESADDPPLDMVVNLYAAVQLRERLEVERSQVFTKENKNVDKKPELVRKVRVMRSLEVVVQT